MKHDIAPSECLPSLAGGLEVIYSDAIIEFDHLWATGGSRASKPRMDELMMIIEQFEVKEAEP